jgi:hypothetical protein
MDRGKPVNQAHTGWMTSMDLGYQAAAFVGWSEEYECACGLRDCRRDARASGAGSGAFRCGWQIATAVARNPIAAIGNRYEREESIGPHQIEGDKLWFGKPRVTCGAALSD